MEIPEADKFVEKNRAAVARQRAKNEDTWRKLRESAQPEPEQWAPGVFDRKDSSSSLPSSPSYSFNPLSPPGLVGEVCDWINAQCRYPRPSLAVAAALTVVGNAGGLRHKDVKHGATGNLFCFCVAPSSTGKEAIAQAVYQLMRPVGLMKAVHGTFKSEQEVYRNLIRNQAAYYCVDEFGLMLAKVINASQRGGASYLEGLVGLIMSAYSKADGILTVAGDVKEAVREALLKEMAQINAKIDREGESTEVLARKQDMDRDFEKVDDGITEPFLSLLGFTTPVTFDGLVTFETATNGFFSRALIFRESESNPPRREDFSAPPLPAHLEARLRMLYAGGHSDTSGKIRRIGDFVDVTTTPEADALLDDVYYYFYERSEVHKTTSSLEAITRRGLEMVGKLSFILALEEGVRTVEHVRWAFEFMKVEIEAKIKMAYSEMNKDNKDASVKFKAQQARILGILSKSPTKLGLIVNRCRGMEKAEVLEVLDSLVKAKLIQERTEVNPTNNKPFQVYWLSS